MCKENIGFKIKEYISQINSTVLCMDLSPGWCWHCHWTSWPQVRTSWEPQERRRPWHYCSIPYPCRLLDLSAPVQCCNELIWIVLYQIIQIWLRPYSGIQYSYLFTHLFTVYWPVSRWHRSRVSRPGPLWSWPPPADSPGRCQHQ